MIERKFSHYELGIEILDKKTKEPIEHREFEKEYDLANAMAYYQEWKLQNDEQKYLNLVLNDGEVITLKFQSRKTTGRVWAEPLDLENASGFVIDLSTPSTTYEALEAVLHSEEDREDLKKELTIYQIREFILEYYLSTYYDAYILMKKPNVYQIIEEELYTKSRQ